MTARATAAGFLVSALLILAIVFGSRLLENFDSALLPYAVATVFLAFGVAYRYTVWISAPGARRGSTSQPPRSSASSQGIARIPRGRSAGDGHRRTDEGSSVASLPMVCSRCSNPGR